MNTSLKKSKKTDSFLNASIISTIGLIITRIISVIYTIPFAFLVQGDAMSISNYSYTIFNQFYELSLAGIPLSIAKLVSKYNSRGEFLLSKYIFNYSMIIMLVLGISLFLGLYTISDSFAEFKYAKHADFLVKDLSNTIKIISPSLILLPLVSGFRGYLQGFKNMIGPTVSQIIERLVFVVLLISSLCICLFFTCFSDTKCISISYIALPISSLISLFVLIPYFINIKKKHEELIATNKILYRRRSKKKIIKEIIYTAFPFVISGLAATLYSTITIIFYDKIRIYSNIPFYQIESECNSILFYTNKLISIPLTFSLALSTSIISYVTYAYEKKNKTQVINYVKKSYSMIILSTLSSCLLIIVFSRPLITFFYGNIQDFELVNSILIVDCFRGLFFAIETIVISLLQSINEKNKAMFYTLLGPLFKFILMFPLVYFFGIYGEVYSIILGLSFVVYLSTKTLKKKLNIKSSIIFTNLFRTLSYFVVTFMLFFILEKVIIINFGFIYTNRVYSFIYLTVAGIVSLIVFYNTTMYARKLYKKYNVLR